MTLETGFAELFNVPGPAGSGNLADPNARGERGGDRHEGVENLSGDR